jgi:hypothetical protein
MTHQQVLDKLGHQALIQAIDDDLARLTQQAMAEEKHGRINNQLAYVLPPLLTRWNCVLNAGTALKDHYKQLTTLALATLLHKYGFADAKITANANHAIDELNKHVILSDDFYRKSTDIKQLLATAPSPLKKRPSVSAAVTFYRAQDVVSVQVGNRFYAAYVYSIIGINESPVIGFYNGVFHKRPSMNDLASLTAKGLVYNDGQERISHFSVYGMKFMPDPANQIHLMEAGVKNPPSDTHLGEPIGLYTVYDLFRLQDTTEKMFINQHKK